MGGISLEPTAAEIEGGSATATYYVLFSGTTACEGQVGMLERVDGNWVVSREVYCGFLASARTPAINCSQSVGRSSTWVSTCPQLRCGLHFLNPGTAGRCDS